MSDSTIVERHDLPAEPSSKLKSLDKTVTPEWKEVRFSSGDIYIGGWMDFQMCGQGHYVHANGNVYDGEMKGNKKHGTGRYAPLERAACG